MGQDLGNCLENEDVGDVYSQSTCLSCQREAIPKECISVLRGEYAG
jgi:hypothetical protein